MELTYSHAQNTSKKIIIKHIPIGNNLITDNWLGYVFINNDNSGYLHYVCNYSEGNFGIDNLSSSHIESI